MFKVERKTSNEYWYEVMLSPFTTLDKVEQYLTKYSKAYPQAADRSYRITTNKKK